MASTESSELLALLFAIGGVSAAHYGIKNRAKGRTKVANELDDLGVVLDILSILIVTATFVPGEPVAQTPRL